MIRKKGKNLHPTTNQQTERKVWNEEYRDPFSGEKRPLAKEDVIQRVKKVLWTIRENPEILTIEEGALVAEIPQSSYYLWIDKYPECAFFHDTALTFLGIRREKYMTCTKHGYREHSLMFKQGQYDKVWKAEQHFLNTLKTKVADAGKPNMLTVEMIEAPHTEEVAQKKAKDKILESK